tara:strand:- start:877 stop:1137 length:261 start_codon:yes stop_codon:yes gene_type:complete
MISKEKFKEKFITINGWLGSFSILLAYSLLSIESEEKLLMDSLNFYGSLTIGIVCYQQKAYQPLFLEVCWFGVTTYSFIKNIMDDE